MGVLQCGVAAQTGTNIGTAKELGTLALALFFSLNIGAFIVLVVASVKKRCAPKQFWAFICHHKADAAARARLLKTLLAARIGRDVFLDSDNLDELAILFEFVKCNTDRLLVLLTRDTLRRPWCVGEVVTSLSSDGVQLLRVEDDTFLQPTEEHLELLDDYIDYSGVNLNQFGITNADIVAAFRQLLGPSVPCFRFDKGVKLSYQCDKLVEDLVQSRVSASEVMTSMMTTSVEDVTNQAVAAVVAISVQQQDSEAVASARLVVCKISKDVLPFARAGLMLLCDLETRMIPQILAKSFATVVMLSSGSLENKEHLFAIAVSMQLKKRATAMGNGPNVIPVALPGFVFPSLHATSEIAQTVWSGETADVIAARESFRDLFQLIAVSLSIHASDSLITVQANEILRRIPRSCAATPAEAVVLLAETSKTTILPDENCSISANMSLCSLEKASAICVGSSVAF